MMAVMVGEAKRWTAARVTSSKCRVSPSSTSLVNQAKKIKEATAALMPRASDNVRNSSLRFLIGVTERLS